MWPCSAFTPPLCRQHQFPWQSTFFAKVFSIFHFHFLFYRLIVFHNFSFGQRQGTKKHFVIILLFFAYTSPSSYYYYFSFFLNTQITPRNSFLEALFLPLKIIQEEQEEVRKRIFFGVLHFQYPFAFRQSFVKHP